MDPSFVFSVMYFSLFIIDSIFGHHGREGDSDTKSLPLAALTTTIPSLSVTESVIKSNVSYPARKGEPLDLVSTSVPRKSGKCLAMVYMTGSDAHLLGDHVCSAH